MSTEALSPLVGARTQRRAWRIAGAAILVSLAVSACSLFPGDPGPPIAVQGSGSESLGGILGSVTTRLSHRAPDCVAGNPRRLPGLGGISFSQARRLNRRTGSAMARSKSR